MGNEWNNILPEYGTEVKIVCSPNYTGPTVKEQYVKSRKSGLGTYHDFIPGTGGDYWWVRNSDGEIGVYDHEEIRKMK